MKSHVIIIGAGISGLIAATELLDKGYQVTLLDRDEEQAIGGLAKWALGGLFFVDTPLQRKSGIKDSVDLAKKDWFSYADFLEEEYWGKEWANYYIKNCTKLGYNWLLSKGIKFLSTVNWVERGMHGDGNSVPRFHLVWGTGMELVKVFARLLLEHPKRNLLDLYFRHRVNELIFENGKVVGVRGINEALGKDFEIRADVTVIATGGISGSVNKIKEYWHKDLGTPPKVVLVGGHKYAQGDLHEAVENINGKFANRDKQWNYAAGIRHYQPRKEEHGLSLIPPKSAIWLNYKGERLGPEPLITGFDTSFLVKRICQEEKKYSWQILNKKIALKELAISGSESNAAIRDKKFLKLVRNILFGNKELYNTISSRCEEFIVADTVEDLVIKMNQLTETEDVSLEAVRKSIQDYDAAIDQGAPYQDEQLNRILKAREWKADKLRTSNLQKISDPKAGPLIAIREYILTRKSMGGIQTNLKCQVLSKADTPQDQRPIPGLYAIGEAAGFGGGGVHGHRALEGTFLGSCIITARTLTKYFK
ncbi:MAG: FAD-binding dehydrogenase [Bacteroidota bacterium]